MEATSFRRPAVDRVRIGPLGVDRVTLADAMAQVRRFVQQGGPHQLVTVNLRYVSIARRDPAFAALVNGTDLAIADGAPLLWLSRLMDQPIPERVTGGDILDACADWAAREGHSVFLLGAAPGVAEDAVRILQGRYPGLRIAGTHHGFFSDDESGKVTDQVRESGAVFLFVAMGCPKQDIWVQRHLDRLQTPVCCGIGGMLEIVTGRLKRAPEWVQRAGLEWLYRLLQEPGRLWRRYLLEDAPTAARLAVSGIRGRVARRRA